MHASNTILSVSHLQIAFGGPDAFTAVKDISFRLERGKTLAIVGESGSGKSLTALALTGLLPHTAALKGNIELTFANKNVPLQHITDNKDWESIRGKEVGMVFQEPMSSLNPVMTIGAQLVESITTHKHLSKKEAKHIALDWLVKVQLPEPETLLGRYPHQLSGGQKQRVMIAMAMCNHPVLLIADEPTTALDVTVQQEIVKLMHSLLQGNTSMIFITHDLSLAATLADDVLVMCKGEVMEYGTAEQVLRSPKNPYTQALVACRPSGEQRGYKLPIVSDFLDVDTSKTMEQITHVPLPSSTIGDEVLLQVNGLRVWFSGNKPMFGKAVEDFKAVDDVSFNLYKGEILGLVGESGCGKSTLSRSLMGLIPIHSGQVLFNGTDLATLQPKD
ncbi:MAG: ATP-binding cassette domain-containing protein, partial [Bacteroidota bacterium]